MRGAGWLGARTSLVRGVGRRARTSLVRGAGWLGAGVAALLLVVLLPACDTVIDTDLRIRFLRGDCEDVDLRSVGGLHLHMERRANSQSFQTCVDTFNQVERFDQLTDFAAKVQLGPVEERYGDGWDLWVGGFTAQCGRQIDPNMTWLCGRSLGFSIPFSEPLQLVVNCRPVNVVSPELFQKIKPCASYFVGEKP